jgi:hypothetical protein
VLTKALHDPLARSAGAVTDPTIARPPAWTSTCSTVLLPLASPSAGGAALV